MIMLGLLGKTTLIAPTSSPADFTNQGTRRDFVVWSNRAVHLNLDTDASTDHFRLDESTYARIHIEPAQVLSFILADGESDSGAELRISEAG